MSHIFAVLSAEALRTKLLSGLHDTYDSQDKLLLVHWEKQLFEGALVVGNYGQGGGCYFRGGHLLEHGCLFKEIRYVSSNTTCRLQAITLSRKSFTTAG